MVALEIIDKNIQKAYEGLKEIRSYMNMENTQPDALEALTSLRVVFHEFRDNIMLESSAHLSAQLPLLIRGMYFENWQLSKILLKERNKEQFIEAVQDHLAHLSHPMIDAEQEIKAVLCTLANKVSIGQINKIKQTLPSHIRELWA
jgi:uncharacterized protein (DUF2267 family)